MKIKKSIKKILWIAWALVGIILCIWTAYFYFSMNSPNNLGIVGWVIKFNLSFYAFILYAAITILFFFIKWSVKKLKRINKFSGKIKRRKPEVSSQ